MRVWPCYMLVPGHWSQLTMKIARHLIFKRDSTITAMHFFTASNLSTQKQKREINPTTPVHICGGSNNSCTERRDSLKKWVTLRCHNRYVHPSEAAVGLSPPFVGGLWWDIGFLRSADIARGMSMPCQYSFLPTQKYSFILQIIQVDLNSKKRRTSSKVNCLTNNITFALNSSLEKINKKFAACGLSIIATFLWCEII